VRLSPASLRLGYLPQGFTFDPHETLDTYLNRLDGELPQLSARLEELAVQLADKPDQPALQLEFDRVLNRIEAAAESSGRAPAVLAALGLGELPPDLPVTALSGGQKTRLALAVYCWQTRSCSCWMSPPIISISRCWSGWKTGLCTSQPPL
jgi:ATP-binding cassette, subfamily F, member 3